MQADSPVATTPANDADDHPDDARLASAHIDYTRHSPGSFDHLLELSQGLHEGPLGATLVELVSLRISQINRCAFCLDMHAGLLRKRGESQRKLDTIAAWRESPAFDERERAALDWAETLNAIGNGPIPEDALGRALARFDPRELSDLTFVVASITAWNMLNVGLRTPLPEA